MRITTKRNCRREGEEKPRLEDVVIWIDELPPEYQRGKFKNRKNRRYKLEKNRQIVDARLDMEQSYW